MAAVLAVGPGGLLTHAHAVAVWGLRPRPRGDIHVTAPRTVSYTHLTLPTNREV